MIEYPLLSRLSKETDAAEDDTEELDEKAEVFDILRRAENTEKK